MRIVLLHAYPFEPAMWDAVLPPLVAEHDVSAPRLYDLPGDTMETWANALEPTLRDGAVLVGASMGGYLALALTRRAPERVRALVLVGAKATPDTPERRAVRDETLRALASGARPPEAPASITADELAGATRALRDRRDQTDVVRLFPRPLLVCGGVSDDILTPEEATALAGSAPAGELELFDGSGHLPPLDEPARFTEVLVGFLARCT